MAPKIKRFVGERLNKLEDFNEVNARVLILLVFFQQ